MLSKITKAAIRHTQIVNLLRERDKGAQFEDHQGNRYEVIRVTSSYPRPGYLAKRVQAKGYAECFVGFDAVKDPRINPTIDWADAHRLATSHDSFPGRVAFCFGEVVDLSLQFRAAFSEEGKVYGADVVLVNDLMYLVFPTP